MESAEPLISQNVPYAQGLSRSGITAFNLILRLGILACFVGHGVIGLMGNPGWLPLFAVAGISATTAYQLMPLIAVMDIILGIALFVRPVRVLLIWAIIWCIWTAIIRPLAGMSWLEFFERAGNFGLPLALFLSTTVPVEDRRRWFGALYPKPLSETLIKRLQIVLTLTTAMLLAGHGGYGLLLNKESLAQHYASLGFGESIQYQLLRFVGAVEIFAAALVLVCRSPVFLISIAGWKLLTELLHPLSGASAWETVERGGSYGAPLALALLYAFSRNGKERMRMPRSGTF